MNITVNKIRYTVQPITGTYYSDIWQGKDKIATITFIHNTRKEYRSTIKLIQERKY